MDQTLLILISLVGLFWPILVSSSYILFRWRFISGKISFLFIASLVGYVLFFMLNQMVKLVFEPMEALSQKVKIYPDSANIGFLNFWPKNILKRGKNSWFSQHSKTFMGSMFNQFFEKIQVGLRGFVIEKLIFSQAVKSGFLNQN